VAHYVGYAALLVASIGSVEFGVAPLDRAEPLGIRTADAADQAPPLVGQKAPDLRLADQYGKGFVLAEAIKDKKFVVVAFYPKAFTGG
jgi:hypothetical protein